LEWTDGRRVPANPDSVGGQRDDYDDEADDDQDDTGSFAGHISLPLFN
jgi:hypothetical protein